MFGFPMFLFLDGVKSDTTSAARSMPVCACDQFFAGTARAAGASFAGVR
jgi:hypothetical protein